MVPNINIKPEMFSGKPGTTADQWLTESDRLRKGVYGMSEDQILQDISIPPDWSNQGLVQITTR